MTSTIRGIRWLHLALAATLAAAQVASGQGSPFGSDLLPAVRRAAATSPGELPVAIRFVSPHSGIRVPMSYLLDGADSTLVTVIYPVFQIRFPRGWVTVDAALDHGFMPDDRAFSDAEYDSVQQALRGARLAVVTHEHHDHIGGIIRSPHRAQIQQHTLLTRSQVRGLIDRPNDGRIRLDSVTASRFLSIDYEPFVAIAPGVVLIKAAGHTAGSQMVYVRLASGPEVILAGDVAWLMAGIARQRHKPDASTRSFGGEERAAVTQQLAWLRDAAAAGVMVIVSHDAAWISQLVARGILQTGFDLRNP